MNADFTFKKYFKNWIPRLVRALVDARYKMKTGRNAPQGVEKVHCECRTDSESYDSGNNTL